MKHYPAREAISLNASMSEKGPYLRDMTIMPGRNQIRLPGLGARTDDSAKSRKAANLGREPEPEREVRNEMKLGRGRRGEANLQGN
jgi:hypothetical protein